MLPSCRKLWLHSLVSLLALYGSAFSYSAVSSSPTVSAQDLAIALPLESLELPAPRAILAPGSVLFPETWYKSVQAGFQNTSVGDSLAFESPYADWRVVSLRIAPCAPLGQTPADDIDTLCWPEVRLVWQPIQRKIRLHERYMLAAADDRAFHAIYPLQASRLLSPAEAQRVAEYRLTIANYQRTKSTYTPLSANEKTDFVQLRNQVLSSLLRDTLALRSQTFPGSAYSSIGLRPEMLGDSQEQTAFVSRLKGFLARYALPDDLRTLTAFSLPEGREPAHLDEWVFLAFRGEKGLVQLDQLRIQSTKDGRTLADLGTSMRGSMTRDEPNLYDLLDDSSESSELKQSVMLTVPDIARLTPAISDRRQHLVPNTSCVSCHKMNPLRFDFHNFSYLEDRELTISPRVKRDVELDLLWLQSKK